ncbi:rab11 family-interacting protein 4 isoform X3 [Apis dorsata]|uniref:rab11 family-interacting protein 4 isoform X3 n=1 Tax=Apis dorsata TaxID=7462 RepID=UPI0003DF5BE5|nr:rab11 family-interacting protein 4 isoform X3 [Apis dorsata]
MMINQTQVQMIQEQMHAFQSVGEERYVRAKQENATLQARILMLEEAAKDAETRAEERLQAEQRRHRDWASRLERERQLQLENYAIKLQAIELEETSLRDEIARLREQLEKVKIEKNRLENDLEEARREIDSAHESERQAISRANEAHYQLKAVKEELTMKIEDQQKIEELMQQVAQLQACNKSLEESRDELQAAAALQAGRELLMLNPCNNSAEKGPSLAVELLAGMNQDQIDGQLSGDNGEPCNISEIKQALKEQQEVNTQLRAYIDGILLNIVENYPQLLEVKQTH